MRNSVEILQPSVALVYTQADLKVSWETNKNH